MSEVKWYSKGDVGEMVLSLLESMYDNQINQVEFCRKATALGLSPEEVIEVLLEEGEELEEDDLSY